MLILSLFHLFLVAPCLLYIGLKRSLAPLWAFKALLGTGLFIVLYHGWRWIGTGSYINLIHIGIIGPILVAIGWKARDSPRALYEILLMVTFALIGWHTLNLIRLLDLHSETAKDISEL